MRLYECSLRQQLDVFNLGLGQIGYICQTNWMKNTPAISSADSAERAIASSKEVVLVMEEVTPETGTADSSAVT